MDFVESFGEVQEYNVYVNFGINIARNFVKKVRMLVKQERLFLKPCWESLISRLLSKLWTIWSRVSDSMILQIWLVRLIGR